MPASRYVQVDNEQLTCRGWHIHFKAVASGLFSTSIWSSFFWFWRQGCSRPSYYRVILDENQYGPDWLQEVSVAPAT
jgi:hypothetical protein